MRRKDPETDDAKKNLVQGLGLLWRAARSAAKGVRKEVGQTDWGKTIDDAGRELVRATSNVMGRLGSELKKVQPAGDDRGDGDGKPPVAPEEPPAGNANGKPKGPTPSDPGFTIAGDRDDDKTPR